MKNLTIISVLLLFLNIGCVPPIELQKCDVELNIVFADIEKNTTITLEFIDCSMKTVYTWLYLDKKTLKYTKAGGLGNRVIANDVNYFAINSTKPYIK